MDTDVLAISQVVEFVRLRAFEGFRRSLRRISALSILSILLLFGVRPASSRPVTWMGISRRRSDSGYIRGWTRSRLSSWTRKCCKVSTLPFSALTGAWAVAGIAGGEWARVGLRPPTRPGGPGMKHSLHIVCRHRDGNAV